MKVVLLTVFLISAYIYVLVNFLNYGNKNDCIDVKNGQKFNCSEVNAQKIPPLLTMEECQKDAYHKFYWCLIVPIEGRPMTFAITLKMKVILLTVFFISAYIYVLVNFLNYGNKSDCIDVKNGKRINCSEVNTETKPPLLTVKECQNDFDKLFWCLILPIEGHSITFVEFLLMIGFNIAALFTLIFQLFFFLFENGFIHRVGEEPEDEEQIVDYIV